MNYKPIAWFFLWIFVTIARVNTVCRHPNTHRNLIVHYPKDAHPRGPFREYSTLSFQCKPGFRRVTGHYLAVCIEGKWMHVHDGQQREAQPLLCHEKPCPVKLPQNGNAKLINKVVYYTCGKGFELMGTNQSRCLLSNKTENYYIEHRLPTCVKQVSAECETPHDPHVIMHGECCYPGDQLIFTCEPDYKLEGESSLLCLDKGQWSSAIPSCMLIDECEDPGTPGNINRTGDCCLVGSILNYTCPEGYEFEDPFQLNPLICLPQRKWNYRRPTCKPKGIITCPEIPLTENNLVVLNLRESQNYLPWEEVELDCQPNYSSDAESLRPMCQPNGQWDSAIPFCEPLNPCRRPPNIQNGRIIELIGNAEQIFPIGFEINVECDDNFEIKTNYYGSRCLGNNVWENGISNCTLIECKDPGIPPNAMRRGDNFHLGKTVTYTCLGKMTLRGSPERTCLVSKRWSGTTPVCDSGTTDCPDPGTPLNSIRKGNRFMVGDTLSYSCPPNHLLIGNGTRVCTQHGNWTGDEIRCIAPDEYPDKAILAMELEGKITEIARLSSSSIPMSRILRSGNGIDIEDMKGVNVYFMFDGSGSITNRQFEQSKELSKALIRRIGISEGSGGVRVGAILFSKNATVKVNPATDKTVTTVIEKIHKMERQSQGTNIANALDTLLNLVAACRRNNETNGSKDVLFLMTDGNANEGGHQPRLQAHELHRKNIDAYVIAVGDKINLKTLELITQNPFKIVKMANYKQLYDLFSKVIGKYTDNSDCGVDRLILAEEEIMTPVHLKKGSSSLNRVVGGEPVKFAWPWIAAIYYVFESMKMFHCGGTIIHAKWILSAAHCFVIETRDQKINIAATKMILHRRNWIVSLGRVKLDDPESGLNAYVRKIIYHKNYDPKTFENDIALVELVSWMQFDIFMRPICLPPPLKDIPQNGKLYAPGILTTLIGWGHDKVWKIDDPLNETKTVEHLNELEMPLQSRETCNRPVHFTYQGATFRSTPAETSICAGSGQGGQDACKGDSGGPLLQFVRTNSSGVAYRWFQLGIVSWGVGCGVKSYFGYFTNVAMLRDWIIDNTNMELQSVFEQT